MEISRLIKSDNKYIQLFRFVIVGGLATIFHYAIYMLINYMGVKLNIAYTIGYFISFIFNFFASNYFTFKSKPNTQKGLIFFGAHIINYFIQIILLNIYIYLGIPSSIAPIGVFIIAIPINFILVKLALKNKASH